MKSKSNRGPFVGMNPRLHSQITFDSNFESGNLDLVVKVSESEYNLFLRPDTNTCGHMQWFYFKATHQPSGPKKVKFHICNNRRSMTLYHRGMKPFILSKHL